MSIQINVQKNIALPPMSRGRAKGDIAYPELVEQLRALEINDSYFIPGATKRTAEVHRNYAKRYVGITLASRVVTEGNILGMRFWKVA